MIHPYINSDLNAWDSNCLTCGGKKRDSIHNTTNPHTVVMEGETWVAHMTPEEYQEWTKYDSAHPQLSPLPVQSILAMFLNHFRRGINLNLPLTR